jgi:hypothetical protein
MPQVIFPGLFPFCVVETENSTLVGTNTFYPVGLSKEDACFLFWKAKKLHIKADYTWSGPLGGDIYNFRYNVDKDLITTNSPAGLGVPGEDYGIHFLPKTETDFICFNKNNSIWWSNDSVLFNFFGFSYYLDTPFCYKFNNLYYLSLTLNFPLATSFLWALSTVTAFPQRENSAGAMQLIINNNTYDINMWYGPANDGAHTVTPVTGSITVSEVWDYSR